MKLEAKQTHVTDSTQKDTPAGGELWVLLQVLYREEGVDRTEGRTDGRTGWV